MDLDRHLRQEERRKKRAETKTTVEIDTKLYHFIAERAKMLNRTFENYLYETVANEVKHPIKKKGLI